MFPLEENYYLESNALASDASLITRYRRQIRP